MNRKRIIVRRFFELGTHALFITIILYITIVSVATASASTQLFFDDFNGIALDPSRWGILGGWGEIQVTDGFLRTEGGGSSHKRIDSPTFAPMGGSVIARARIQFAGDYQKFGFRVNPTEFAGQISGYHFETYSRSEDEFGQENAIYAVAWSKPASGPPVNLLRTRIGVTWYEFHEFAIERTPLEVIFSIDGKEVARVADAFENTLPVGVWNDRWGLMLTDWVEVSQTGPSLTLTLTGCITCRTGDQFTVQAHVTNPGSRDVPVEAKVGVRLPDGTPINLLGDKHLEVPLPASLDTTFTLFDFSLPDGLPPGTWSLVHVGGNSSRVLIL